MRRKKTNNDGCINYFIYDALLRTCVGDWRSITASQFAYPLCPGVISVIRALKNNVEYIMYRLRDADVYKMDVYRRVEIGIREIYGKDGPKTKRARINRIKKVIDKELESGGFIFGSPLIFCSKDITPDVMKMPRVSEIVEELPKGIDERDIIMRPIGEYDYDNKKGRKAFIVEVNYVMQDEDCTPHEAYMSFPIGSFNANKGDGSRVNPEYVMMRNLVAQTAIIGAQEWIEDIADEVVDDVDDYVDDDSVDMKDGADFFGIVGAEDDSIEDAADDEDKAVNEFFEMALGNSPVQISSNGSCGFDDKGWTFTKKQMDGINPIVDMCIYTTTTNDWEDINPADYDGLVGMDFAIKAKCGGVTVVISSMDIGENNVLYAISTYDGGKKISVENIEESDFVNYSLCRMQMERVVCASFRGTLPEKKFVEGLLNSVP